MKFYKQKKYDRNRIAPSSIDNIFEMHRNISENVLSKKRFNDFLSYLKILDLDKYPNIDPLISKIAAKHNVKNKNLMVTSGIDGGLKSVFEMCSCPGDKIATYYPTYAMYKVYSEIFDLKMIDIKFNLNLKVTLDDLVKVMDEDISILFLPNPNMPIEFSFNFDEIDKIVGIAQKKEILVVVDEAYALFGSDTSIPLISKYDNLLIARTFSKAIGLPGIRLGYMLGQGKLISYLQTRRFAHESNALSVAAGMWALDNDNKFEKIKDKVVSTRDWFKSELLDLGISCYGSETNTVILNLKNRADANNLSSVLKQHGFLIKNNYPEGYNNFVSITIGEHKLMIKLLYAIKNHLFTN